MMNEQTMMNTVERDEFLRRAEALSPEEQVLLIETIPTTIIYEELGRRLSSQIAYIGQMSELSKNAMQQLSFISKDLVQ